MRGEHKRARELFSRDAMGTSRASTHLEDLRPAQHGIDAGRLGPVVRSVTSTSPSGGDFTSIL
jgi:hypothetical protein